MQRKVTGEGQVKGLLNGMSRVQTGRTHPGNSTKQPGTSDWGGRWGSCRVTEEGAGPQLWADPLAPHAVQAVAGKWKKPT